MWKRWIRIKIWAIAAANMLIYSTAHCLKQVIALFKKTAHLHCLLYLCDFNLKFTHLLAHSLTHSLPLTHCHWLTHSLTDCHCNSLTQSLNQSIISADSHHLWHSRSLPVPPNIGSLMFVQISLLCEVLYGHPEHTIREMSKERR